MSDGFYDSGLPSDAAILAARGTTDPVTGLVRLTPAGNTPAEARERRNFERLIELLAPLAAGRLQHLGALNIGVNAFDYRMAGVDRHFAGGTVTAVEDETNVLFLDEQGVLTLDAEYPPNASTYVPIGAVTVVLEEDETHTVTLVPHLDRLRYAAPVNAGLGLAISVAPEQSNAIDVTFQVQDAGGENLAGRFYLRFWVGDTAYGTICVTAPNGGLSVVAGTKIEDYSPNKHVLMISDATGKITMRLTDSGTPTYYCMAELAGRIGASDAVTFA